MKVHEGENQACFQLSAVIARIAFFYCIHIVFLVYPKGLLVSKIRTANITCQEGFEIFMGHPDVVFQTTCVFESFSALTALQP